MTDAMLESDRHADAIADEVCWRVVLFAVLGFHTSYACQQARQAVAVAVSDARQLRELNEVTRCARDWSWVAVMACATYAGPLE